MMDWTDRYCRVFHRTLSKRTLLYTEMVVADAIIHGPRERLLGFDAVEHPVALQIGGSDPAKLAQATKIGSDYGYDEVNINIGCPSDRVQSGRFGACLMAEPELVAECYAAMAAVSAVPVTVKCRLGIDDQALEQTLPHFLETVAKAGCTRFIIHARKAWLEGLSPKQNRDVPPLDYGLVRQMKAQFDSLTIELNGGLKTLDEAMTECESLDGVMFGRAAYQNPWLLTEVDAQIFGEATAKPSREDVVRKMIDVADTWQEQGLRTRALTRHMLGLYFGTPGARAWRRTLSEKAAQGVSTSDVLRAALDVVTEAQHASDDAAMHQ